MRIFLTGATGYVGGQALHSIASSFAAASTIISCLVRDKDKAQTVKDKYPDHVQTVIGDLGDGELMENESLQADIVLHLASTNHLSSCQAIFKGLSKKPAGSISYWIQMSGASLFVIPQIKEGRYGEASDEVYHDLGDTEKILAIIRKNPSRSVDNLIVSQDSSKIRTALVLGPLIYGQGAGPGNQRSIQVPEIVKTTLNYGEGFRFAKGLNRWSSIHVRDLGDLFLHLAKAAQNEKAHGWNKEGIYLPANGDMAFGEVCERVAQAAYDQKLIKSPKVERTIGVDEANEATSAGAIFGAPMQCLALREASRCWGGNLQLRRLPLRSQKLS
ncbi:hypothetical protein EDD36DRAFT_462147 [Exophiala viscosa]|uniref:NAD(P)-binding domain-containing protein n=1 Tax=Exophiala viscosa TaxID=2486360 RepID=A0AAN6E360_9EURO|nr:hypothetical protein EDD36DRAFT_462147 [Exophiala viscosa]